MNIVHALGVSFLLGMYSVTAPCAEPATAPVQPLGEFARVRATEDHTYGHRVQLWRSGGRLLGEIWYWDGNIEGQRGRFVDGAYNQRTGVVIFKTVIVRRDLQPNTRTDVSFDGFLVKGTLAGKLTWTGERAKFRGKNGVEELVLPWQKEERLAPYASVEAWRKDNAD